MAQYSMALNNSDYLSGKPDARTGLFAKTLTLGKLKGNYQAGPDFKLQIGFNPQQAFINSLTPFGSGWDISIPSFIRSSTSGDGHLSLPSGKSFYIPELIDGPVAMEGYKLQDVQITWDSNAWVLTVVQKSGDISTYSAIPGDQTSGNLYLTQTTSDEGRSLYFTYDNITFPSPDGNGMLICLNTVTDDVGTTLASVDYSGVRGNGTVITLQADGSTPRQFTFNQVSNSLATISGPEQYEAYFTYYDNQSDGGVAMYLLSTVADTSGLYETLTYSTASDLTSGGITQIGGANTQTTVQQYRRAGDVTDNSTDYIATYSFPPPGANQYNYLGNPVVVSANELTDSLLHYDGDFTYTSTMTEQVIWPSPEDVDSPDTVNKITTTTYNKFHSVIQKVVSFYSDSSGSTYDGTHTVTEDWGYPATTGKIDTQVATYALANSHTKTWSDGITSATESQSFSWDDYANLTSHTSKSGVNTQRAYYSAAGETGCPPDPYGIVRYLKTKIVTPGNPSSTDTSLPVAPTRQYDYTYAAVSGYSGASLIRRTGMIQSEDGGKTPQLTKAWDWNSATDLLNAARLASHSETLPGNYVTTKALAYTLQDGDATLRTVATHTGYDGLQRKERIDRSTVTGKVMASADVTVSDTSPAVTVNYTRDALGRVTGKTACQGTAYEATQTTLYTPAVLTQRQIPAHQLNINPRLGSSPTANPVKITTDASGVQSQSVTDSSGNELQQLVQDVDAVVSTDTQKFWVISETRYDGLGNTVTSTNYDWFPNASAGTPSVTTTTTTLYDVWGEEYASLMQDGHIETSQHDPLTLTTYSSVTAKDGTETQKQRETEDVSGKTLKTERLAATGTTVYSTDSTDYDGLGRKVRSTDAENNITLFTWDAYNRPQTVTRPDGSLISPVWALHSTSSLISAIGAAESGAQDADQYTFGTQDFDGLNRVTKLSVANRQSVYTYANGSATKPVTVSTPTNDTLTYTYQQELNEAVLTVTSSADGEEAALAYTYNNATGDVKTSNSDLTTDDYAHRTLTYTASGQLSQNALSYQLKGGESATRSQSMTFSLGSSSLTTTDVSGLVHVQTYDDQGRQTGYTLTSNPDDPSATLSSVAYGYDSAGRQNQTTTTDSLSTNVQTTTLTWDDQGREYQRTLAVSGTVSGTQEQALTYNLNDQITTRTSTRNGQPWRTETYDYTVLGQMQDYKCTDDSGTGDYPDSPDDYRLTGQQFTFDFIGNIKTVVSDLLDSSGGTVTNTATYTQSTPDRTQLASITNIGVSAWDVTLSYDGNGNMTTDEQGRVLTYNSRNQLMSLSDAQGQLLGYYRYDANGIQMAEKNEASGEDAVTLYYQSGGGLINELQGALSSTYVETLACAFQDGAGTDSVQLIGSDQQGSVIQVSDASEVAWRVYDPYGYSK